jgi:hypothetical protein
MVMPPTTPAIPSRGAGLLHLANLDCHQIIQGSRDKLPNKFQLIIGDHDRGQ